MRKAIALVVLYISIIYFTGCGNTVTYLNVVPDSIVFGKQGGIQKLAVMTDGSRWSIKWCPEWAKASKNGDTLIFECGYLQTKTTNFDTLYLESGDLIAAIPVKQYGRASFVKFTPELLRFPQSGGTAQAKLETDAEKIKIVTDSNVDAVIENKVITLTLSPNQFSDEINSYAIVMCDQIEGRLHYVQAGTGKSVKKRQAVRCSECGGLGKILTSYNLYSHEKTYEECPLCHGTGK